MSEQSKTIGTSKISITTKEEIERQRARKIRAETTYLEILVEAYPEQAKRFVKKHAKAERGGEGESCAGVV